MVLNVVAVLVNLGCAPGKPVLLSGARGEGGALAAGEHGDNHQGGAAMSYLECEREDAGGAVVCLCLRCCLDGST